MDIRHLQYFVETARAKNFTKAAQRLYVTQPTVSKMVRTIEDELGVTLFDRSSKAVELTDAGTVIFRQAESIVKSFEQLSTELNDLMALKKGEVHIGLPPMVGSHFFPKIIRAFRDQYPLIAIHLVEDGANKIEAAVNDGTLDIGVVVLPVDESRFHTHSILNEPLMVLLHPSHALAGRDRLSLKELAHEAFILFREDFALHDRIIDACVRSGFQPRIVFESSQWDFIREMVAANLGVTLLPKPVCRDLDPAYLRAVPLVEQTIPWHLGLIWRKDRYLSYAAREWLRFTKAQWFGNDEQAPGEATLISNVMDN